MMANVLAALRSRLDSILRRLLLVDATATDVIRRVNFACGVVLVTAGCWSTTQTLSATTDGLPRFKIPTAAVMAVQVVAAETNEMPVLFVVDIVGAAEETAPLILSRWPPDAMPLFCFGSFRLLIRFLAVKKIRQ